MKSVPGILNFSHGLFVLSHNPSNASFSICGGCVGSKEHDEP